MKRKRSQVILIWRRLEPYAHGACLTNSVGLFLTYCVPEEGSAYRVCYLAASLLFVVPWFVCSLIVAWRWLAQRKGSHA